MALDPVTAAFDLGKTIITRFFPDKEEAQKKQFELQALLLSGELNAQIAQLKINEKEAENPNRFISGWRPFIGWICGTGLAYEMVILPFLTWFSSIEHIPAPPSLDISTLRSIVTCLLGFGGFRTYEKNKNVARN